MGPVDETTLRGRLVVALPPLVDENFDRTVVLMLEHTDEGALGVVLNRPSERPVADLLERWAEYTSPPSVVFAGGPVETDAVIGLALSGSPDDPPRPSVGEIGTVDLTTPPDEGPHLRALRLFAGYAGWAPQQLEQELAAGAWVAVDGTVDDAFGADPGSLWRTVLRRQGGTMAWMANYPDEPAVN
jgi:putative transcriptional regulator